MSTEGSLAQDLYYLAPDIRALYHLATAQVGNFNADTDGFYAWLQLWIGGSRPGHDHVSQQICAAIYDPRSDIAQRLADIENSIDPDLPGEGPQMYFIHLIQPYIAEGYGNVAPELLLGLTNNFTEHMVNYRAEVLRDPNAYDSFGEYLRTINYRFDGTCGGQGSNNTNPTPSPRPTNPQPEPTTGSNTGSGIPNEGSILYNRPLTEWRSYEDDMGWAEPIGTTLHIGVYGGEGNWIANWTNEDTFADISASVDVRWVSGSTDAAGCVGVRFESDASEYVFCIFGDGYTFALYQHVDENGEWQSEDLLEESLREATRPASEWNSLKIITRGNQFWFVANNVLLGAASHAGRSAGSVAVEVQNFGSSDAEFEFSNLVVRDLN